MDESAVAVSVEAVRGRPYYRVVVHGGGPLPINFYDRPRAERIAEFLESELREEEKAAQAKIARLLKA